ncbi:MAG: hypothetical protein E6J28_13390 [Chloroflexi bacterium]|nr:MAG: hypothetical protein E6J28_13390 [Chloroflexota bacterium]
MAALTSRRTAKAIPHAPAARPPRKRVTGRPAPPPAKGDASDVRLSDAQGDDKRGVAVPGAGHVAGAVVRGSVQEERGAKRVRALTRRSDKALGEPFSVDDVHHRADLVLERLHQALEVSRVLETLVDQLLQGVAHGREHGRDQRHRDDDRGVRGLAGERNEETLQRGGESCVQPGEDRGHRDVDDRAPDDQVDLVEPVAEDRRAGGDGYQRVRQGEDEKLGVVLEQVVVVDVDRDVTDEREHDDCRGRGHPLHLLPQHGASSSPAQRQSGEPRHRGRHREQHAHVADVEVARRLSVHRIAVEAQQQPEHRGRGSKQPAPREEAPVGK